MKKIALIGALFLLPIVASAQFTNLEQAASSVGRIINILVPVVFTLGLLVFFWGLVRYIFGQEHDKEQAKKTMLWGVIALFVMSAVWGLTSWLGESLGLTEVDSVDIPGINEGSLPTP